MSGAGVLGTAPGDDAAESSALLEGTAWVEVSPRVLSCWEEVWTVSAHSLLVPGGLLLSNALEARGVGDGVACCASDDESKAAEGVTRGPVLAAAVEEAASLETCEVPGAGPSVEEVRVSVWPVSVEGLPVLEA